MVLYLWWVLFISAEVAPTPTLPPISADNLEFFERRIRPLLAQHCFACHSASAKQHKGGLQLDSRAALSRGGDSGPTVIAGQPDDSLLILAVRYNQESLQMPPTGKLPHGAIAELEEWVRRGALFPLDHHKSGLAHDPKTRASTGAIDWEAGRQHWAFQPVREQTLPAVKQNSWPRNRVDTFLLAAMEKAGLAPSTPAARQVLARRLFFDLVGLPPTPAEMETFVQDIRPDAYERLVDRLLASPAHGERWARFWLDLARYCDIPEEWLQLRGEPWRYRDWVVDALNADLPYDQFVQRQIAADLMELPSRENAALGFLGLSPSYWKELKLDKDVIRLVVAEEWEERIHAVSGTFLGLTVACARCHDHKFDPVSMSDYYALAGVFASIKQTDRPLADPNVVRATQTQMQQIRAEMNRLPPRHEQRPILEAALRRGELQLRQASAVAPGVAECSLFVEADGPHRTKLTYKPGVAQDVAVQIRGNPAHSGQITPRRFLTVWGDNTPFRQGSGRRELARALVTTAAPLVARVYVNRVWKHHFGSALVATTSDFGKQGTPPTHPELLDDLTARFMARGWSTKWLHRELVLSAAYQQSSQRLPGGQALDPDNRWLWRMNPRRLEIEAWRDAMLAVSGVLQRQNGGAPMDLSNPHNYRRTLYGQVKRRELNDVLRLHDFPDPIIHSPGRLPTTTPLQQLYTLNAPFPHDQATSLSRRLSKETPEPAQRVRRAYQLLLGREPSARQVQWALAFLHEDTEANWTRYFHALLASNEFLFID